MSISVNKVILVGRVGRDPETRFTSGGKAVCNFTLATDETYKDRNGEKQKKTEWHNIVVWGASVEAFVQPYVKKGSLVYVEGKLQTRSWEDKQSGAKRYTTEINVSDIKLEGGVKLEGGDKQGSSKPATRAARPVQQPAQEADDSQGPEISDEDIPF